MRHTGLPAPHKEWCRHRQIRRGSPALVICILFSSSSRKRFWRWRPSARSKQTCSGRKSGSIQFYGKSKCAEERLPIKTDQDTLREAYRFIRSEEDDLDSSWEQRLAKRYYDKLFKEYCIADMSRYKQGKIGLRWRVEKEVISGKGQFICGNSKCDEREGLSSYEVNFSYKEAGENKQALVKLRACDRCATKLNYKKRKEKEKQLQEEGGRRKRLRYDNEDKQGSGTESDNETDSRHDRKDKRKERGVKSPSSEICKHKGDLNVGGEFDKYFEGMFL